MSMNEMPAARPFAPGPGFGDPLAAANRVSAQEREEAQRQAEAAVDDDMPSIVSEEVKQLAERRALAQLVTEFVRRKHAKRALPSAGDAAITWQIADLLSHVAGAAPGDLDPAFGEDILPKGPAVNPDVDRAMRKGAENSKGGDGAV
jgi:hypothetical protein